MAAINDLISQIDDEELKKRITEELEKLTNQKKFGLVFEEHLPECVPLYDVPIKKGCKVALKTGKVNEYYTVMQVEGNNVYCTDKKESQLINFLKKDLVCIAEFGESIYPYLKQIDSIYKSDDKELPTHALIQADNYHALQLLEYLYAGKVDCIYIDPPYNTGARDWKYNNDYVDSSDTYRHSKWLSMMKKRLLLAKKLLNPTDSVMIVTIDEKEYLHLGCLLEELFPDASIQMITDVTSPRAGASRNNEFSRSEEYIFIIQFGSSSVGRYLLTGIEKNEKKENNSPIWFSLLRTGNHSSRNERPNLFYPVWVTKDGKLHSVGESVPKGLHIQDLTPPEEGLICLLPTRPNGDENTWNFSSETLKAAFNEGTARIRANSGRFVISYLRRAEKKRIEEGELELYGKDTDGSWLIRKNENVKRITTTKSVWQTPAHDAGLYGTMLIKNILCNKRFDFPKSLYAVHDTIRFFVGNKPNALIVDFFAGSGTTLHAVNLLNMEDNGKRQCIMVTNNEVRDDEAKALSTKGFTPGDAEWENLGIANYVTWPRTVCSINGKDIKGENLKGNYIGSDIPMADGFKANAVFFKLGFLDKTSVQLGRQFKELLPLLWLKAGGWGKCPESEKFIKDNILPPYIILPDNHFAVLIDEKYFSEFESKVNSENEIWTAYIVTDFEKGFKSMTKSLNVKKSYQLYRDYLDNFRINTERN